MTGETTKGGIEQGAVILARELARWHSEEKDKHAGDEKVFTFLPPFLCEVRSVCFLHKSSSARIPDH